MIVQPETAAGAGNCILGPYLLGTIHLSTEYDVILVRSGTDSPHLVCMFYI